MHRVGRLVAVEGISASGKSTLVREVARRFGWSRLSEAVDRLDPAPSLDFRNPKELLALELTLLAEESRRYRAARALCAEGRTVIADTGFLGPVTYTVGLMTRGRAPARVGRTVLGAARSLARRRLLGVPDLTVFLDTRASERAERARRGRRNHPVALARRHEVVGRVEREYWLHRYSAALPGRLAVVAGRGRISHGAEEVYRALEASRERPTSRNDVLRALTALARSVPRRTARKAAPTVKKPTRSARLPRHR